MPPPAAADCAVAQSAVPVEPLGAGGALTLATELVAPLDSGALLPPPPPLGFALLEQPAKSIAATAATPVA
jgi:hypothetical protein